MKIYAINSEYKTYSRKNLAKVNTQKIKKQSNDMSNVTFRGGKGGAIGIVAGAALLSAMHAQGLLDDCTDTQGAASCTHIGGIAGSIIEDKFGK